MRSMTLRSVHLRYEIIRWMHDMCNKKKTKNKTLVFAGDSQLKSHNVAINGVNPFFNHPSSLSHIHTHTRIPASLPPSHPHPPTGGWSRADGSSPAPPADRRAAAERRYGRRTPGETLCSERRHPGKPPSPFVTEVTVGFVFFGGGGGGGGVMLMCRSLLVYLFIYFPPKPFRLSSPS